jgi:hypothetical protein
MSALRNSFVASALVAFAVAPPAAAAEPPKAALEAVRGIAGRFLAELKGGDAERAADAIALEFSLPDRDRKRFRKRLQALVERAGALEEWAVAGQVTLPGGDRYLRLLLVSYHANRPVGWQLGFYRTAAGQWIILNISFDSDDVPAFLAAVRSDSAAR